MISSLADLGCLLGVGAGIIILPLWAILQVIRYFDYVIVGASPYAVAYFLHGANLFNAIWYSEIHMVFRFLLFVATFAPLVLWYFLVEKVTIKGFYIFKWLGVAIVIITIGLFIWWGTGETPEQEESWESGDIVWTIAISIVAGGLVAASRLIPDDKMSLRKERQPVPGTGTAKGYYTQPSSFAEPESPVNATGFSLFAGCETPDELKKRYKELLKTYHPDVNIGDTEAMQVINDEYNRLLNEYEQK